MLKYTYGGQHAYPHLHMGVKPYPDSGRINSAQGCAVKHLLGIGKRSHHTKLLHALALPCTQEIINKNILTFFNQVFKVCSPLRTLCFYFMSEYITTGRVYEGTLVSRVVNMGYSPTDCAFNVRKTVYIKPQYGVIDSLQYLVYHKTFNKPGAA